MRLFIPVLLLASSLAVGCGKGDKKPDDAKKVEPAGGGDMAEKGPSADAAPAAKEDETAPELAGTKDVPAAEDFEEKAAAEVKPENLEDEVKKMEKEIGTE